MQQNKRLFSNLIFSWLALASAIGCGGTPPEVTDSSPSDTPPVSAPTPNAPADSRAMPTIPGQTVTVDPEGNARLETDVEGAEAEIEVAANDNSLDLPAGFPQELAYPGASVKFTQWASGSETGSAGSIILIAEEPVATVVSTYQTKLTEAGWSAIEMPFAATSEEASASAITAEKGNLMLVATIATDRAQNNTVISLQVQPRP